MSLIMKCAIKSNAPKGNRAAGHDLRVPRQRVRQAAMLTMEQIASLVASSLEPYRPAIWLLVFTGLRPAELCGLRIGDIDLIRGVVHVSGTRSPAAAPRGTCLIGPRGVALRKMVDLWHVFHGRNAYTP